MILLITSVLCVMFFPLCYSEHQLTYAKLQSMGLTCYPNDTCSAKRSDDFLAYSRCQCGEWCMKAKSCCIDSPYFEGMATAKLHKLAKCTFMPTNLHVKMMIVTECDPGWMGDPMVKYWCENEMSIDKELLAKAPVTNPDTDVTYKNYFCAVCNNDIKRLDMWNIRAQRFGLYSNNEILEEVNPDNMKFNPEVLKWELTLPNKEPELIGIFFVPQKGRFTRSQLCMDHLISDCDPSWKDNTVRQMCRDYMAIVIVDRGHYYKERFRNVFCAICNYVDLHHQNMCSNWVTEDFGYQETIHLDTSKVAEMSANILLDIRLEDGNQVGIRNRCGEGKMYDPFFKKCRSLVCGSHKYIRRKGKCVKGR